MAVIECEPTTRMEVVNVALDVVVVGTWERLRVAIGALPSRNVTVPVGKPLGVPDCVFETVAVNVAGVPRIVALGGEITVLVLSWAALVPIMAKTERTNKVAKRRRSVPTGDELRDMKLKSPF